METVGQNDIFIVDAGEFASLVDVEKDEAGELPNGLYLIGDTALDRVQAAGVDSDKLTRAVLEGVSGFASSIEDHPDDPEALQAEQVSVSRVYSAHHVFLGSMKLELAGRPIDEPGIMIMVKPHIENGGASQKPFRELGNLGLMQDMEMPGVYRPVGILKSDKVKYVMTEFRPGVTTLSDRHWYGKRGTGTQRRKMTYEEQTASREEDAEVVVASCEMLGEIHAQGIFHGDAQAKNIGWARMPLSEVTKPSVK
ncbi:MAG: hypothetical protein KDD43_12080, partial [Bdellovibrionales bacterium]|nr:hypothetical protein [Bdellovibrionales bacterium]